MKVVDDFVVRVREYQKENGLYPYNHQESSAAKKKEDKPKSKVARLSPMYHPSYALHHRPGTTIFAKMKNQIATIASANPGTFKGLILGSKDSYALASDSFGQWYCKAGCCEGIKNFVQNGRIWYYIPHVGLMSKGKKLRYVQEVADFLGVKIDFVEIQEYADGLSVFGGSGKGNLYKPMLTAELGGQYDRPRVWCAAKEWLVFSAEVQHGRQSLAILQFLRALYTNVECNINHNNNVKAGLDSKTVFISQPQTYFRLKRWFPNLSKPNLFMLSFCISGANNVSSTYFPFYRWYYVPKHGVKFLDFISDRINDVVASSCVESVPYRLAIENDVIVVFSLAGVIKKFPSAHHGGIIIGGSGVITPQVVGNRLSDAINSHVNNDTAAKTIINQEYLKLNKAGFKSAITWIAKFSGNKSLLKEIE